ncbi:hypothetical protein NP493_1062g00063 [Ridgeia piscesae]|uniref:Secreted protein n=1 Tax=Ridgeia piscesae TaxID=27915 RepID=A0AAD9KHW6_RIDPI|nr:hypothetical protein NP493_1062g00063 [Ridgeia piscesae]
MFICVILVVLIAAIECNKVILYCVSLKADSLICVAGRCPLRYQCPIVTVQLVTWVRQEGHVLFVRQDCLLQDRTFWLPGNIDIPPDNRDVCSVQIRTKILTVTQN